MYELPDEIIAVLTDAQEALSAYNCTNPDSTLLDASGNLRALTRINTLLKKNAIKADSDCRVRCPQCASDEIAARCDAYANYSLVGFDRTGSPVLAAEPDVCTFDDRVYVCEKCGFETVDANDLSQISAK